MNVWVHRAGAGPAFPSPGQVGSLLPAGVEPCEHAAARDDTPGLVFFERVSDELCEWSAQAARAAEAPVFAVSVDDDGAGVAEPWRLLEAGVADVFAWHADYDLAAVIGSRLQRWWQAEALIRAAGIRERLVGHSRAWRRLVRQVVEIAHFTDDAVLVMGESGTGKELIARVVHDLDPRPDKSEFVVVDCTTLTPELAGSELFGHERGAFTGALGARDGAVALADRGTLFLDEIGELALPLQAQLLRVLQERAYKRVGSNTWLRSRFRLVSATNRDLQAEVARGGFRADLYYRIAGWICTTPPLRERTEDILPLACHFLAQCAPDRCAPALDGAVRDYLLAQEYPGNVRDLRLVVSRLGHRHCGPGPITAGDVPEADRPHPPLPRGAWLHRHVEGTIRQALDRGVGLKELGQCVADAAIRVALEMERGNLQRAARRLGVTDRALQMRRATERPR